MSHRHGVIAKKKVWGPKKIGGEGNTGLTEIGGRGIRTKGAHEDEGKKDNWVFELLSHGSLEVVTFDGRVTSPP